MRAASVARSAFACQLALRNYVSHRKCSFPAAGDEGLLRRPKFLSSRVRQLAGWVGLLLSEAEGLERAPGTSSSISARHTNARHSALAELPPTEFRLTWQPASKWSFGGMSSAVSRSPDGGDCLGRLHSPNRCPAGKRSPGGRQSERRQYFWDSTGSRA